MPKTSTLTTLKDGYLMPIMRYGTKHHQSATDKWNPGASNTIKCLLYQTIQLLAINTLPPPNHQIFAKYPITGKCKTEYADVHVHIINALVPATKKESTADCI